MQLNRWDHATQPNRWDHAAQRWPYIASLEHETVLAPLEVQRHKLRRERLALIVDMRHVATAVVHAYVHVCEAASAAPLFLSPPPHPPVTHNVVPCLCGGHVAAAL